MVKKTLFFTLILFLTKVLAVSAKTFVFTGVFWANGNFDLPGLPSDSDDVIINKRLCIINSHVQAKCRNLTLTEDEIVLQTNSSLSIYGLALIKSSNVKASIEVGINSQLNILGKLHIQSQFYNEKGIVKLIGIGSKASFSNEILINPFGSIIAEEGSELIFLGGNVTKSLPISKMQIHHLTINSRGRYNLGNNLSAGVGLGKISGNLTIKSGILHTNGFNLVGLPSKSITIYEGGNLMINTLFGFPKGFGTVNLNPYSTVTYTRLGNQDIDSLPYFNLNISGLGIKRVIGKTTVNGEINVLFGRLETQNNLTLLSNNLATGSIGYLCNSCEVTGQLKIQRQIPSNQLNTNNLILGSWIPNNSFTKINDSLPLVGIAGGAQPNHNQPSVLFHHPDSATNNDFGIRKLNNISAPFSHTQGFLVKPDSLNKKTLMLQGEIFIGDTTLFFGSSTNSNFNLFANPYPSAIRFNFSDFNPKNCYNPITIDEQGNFVPIQFMDTLHLGEGFFVQAASNGATLTFTESQKIGNKGNNILGSGKRFMNSVYNNELQIILARPDGTNDISKIVFSELPVNLGFDTVFDGKKIPNLLNKTNLATVQNNLDFSINYIPQNITGNLEIPIKIWKPNASSINQNLNLIISNIEHLKAANFCINLVDKQTGIVSNLSADTIISFQKLENDTAIRFVLQLSNPIQLSIQNVLCKGDSNGNVVASLSEQNLHYLWKTIQNDTLQVGTKADNFDEITQLKAGKYQLIVSDHSSCGTTKIPFEITESDSLVTIGFKASKVKVAANLPDSIIFTNSSKGALQYVWSFGDGDSAFTYHAKHYYREPGNYRVSLYAIENTCIKDSVIDIEALNVGISESFEFESFTTFQNSQNQIIMAFSEANKGEVFVYNAIGKLVYQNQVNFMKNIPIVVTQNFSSGMYIIKFVPSDRKSTFTNKIIFTNKN